MTKYQKPIGGAKALKNRNPYLRILNRQPVNERIKIRLEYTQDAFDKLEGVEKQIMEKHIETLTSLGDGLGKSSAIVLLAAIGQVLDDMDWPKENPGPFDWMNDND